MKNRNCALLLQYVYSILYESEFQVPDLETLEPEYGELGEGLRRLRAAVKELKRREQKLEDMAYHDPGTGLYNQRFFREYAERMLQAGEELTLCYIDLDGLKCVNDRYGHQAGDQYIRRIVSEIQGLLHITEVFARIGGDEFCILFPESCRKEADRKMRQALEELRGEQLPCGEISFSYGIVATDEGPVFASLDELLLQADQAMYACKRQKKLSAARIGAAEIES